MKWLAGLFATAFLLSASVRGQTPSSRAADANTLQGIVLAAESNQPVEGCRVRAEGEESAALSDSAGAVSLVWSRAGSAAGWRIEVLCPGREPVLLQGSGMPAAPLLLRVPRATFSERITVIEERPPRTEGPRDRVASGAALPASGSVAEALDAASEAVVHAELGVADRISIRGSETRLVATRLNGEALPAIEGELRTAGLSTLPLEILGSVEIHTTFLPEMDADAIGGVVNLEPTRPSRGRFLELFGESRYQDLGGTGLSSGVRTSGHIARLGWRLDALYRDVRHSVDRLEQRFEAGDLERHDLRDHEFRGSLGGASGSLELELSASTRLVARGLTSHTRIGERRWRTKQDRADREIEREVKDTEVKTRVNRFSVTLDHWLSRTTTLQASLFYSGSMRSEPERADSSFVQQGVTFDDEGRPIDESLALFGLDKIGLEDNRARSDGWTLAVDRTSTRFPASAWTEWKLGGKLRRRARSQDYNTTLLRSEDFLSLASFAGSDGRFLFRGQRPLGPIVDAARVRSLLQDPRLEARHSVAEDGGDFDAGETSWASYVQGRFEPAPGVELIAGVRYEGAAADYLGFVLAPGPLTGELAAVPAQGEWHQGEVLPSFQLRAQIAPSLTLGGGVSRTFARPNFYDLVPYELIDLDDQEIERGNPTLRSTLAWNLDVDLAWEPSGALRVRSGAFVKDLSNVIFQTLEEIEWNGDSFEVTSLGNGKRATLSGVELSLAAGMPRLPALRFQLAGTAIESQTVLLDGRSQRLPGQASYSVATRISYRRGPWSVALLGKLVGDMLWEAGDEAEADVWRQAQARLDLSAELEPKGRWAVGVHLQNVADQPSRWIQDGRPRSEELGGRTLALSFRIRQ